MDVANQKLEVALQKIKDAVDNHVEHIKRKRDEKLKGVYGYVLVCF